MYFTTIIISCAIVVSVIAANTEENAAVTGIKKSTTTAAKTANRPNYRILAFLPIPSKSHHRVWQPLLRELANRGHHITLVSPIGIDSPPSNINFISFGDDVEFMNRIMKRSEIDESKFMGARGLTKHFTLMDLMRKWGIALVKETLEHPNVKKLIQSDLEFDAMIVETSFVQEPFIALQDRFKAVTIEINTCGNWHWGYWVHGNPLDTNYIVDSSVPYSDRMTLLERIQNTINSLITRTLFGFWYAPEYQELMDKYLTYPGWESRPSMMEMMRKTSLVLANVHYSLNYPYPISPNFKEVGGLNLVPTKPLPKDLQEFMDGAKDGVIYFTLGSYLQVSSIIGQSLKPIFIKVFSELKQRVLMKWETEMIDLPPNVKISEWFPQQDILAHKNMKLFISHGGFLSMTEAVNQGVPILGIPMLGDQIKNVKHVTYNGYGLELDFENITESTLRMSINEIINNPKYALNARKRSEMFRDKPETALETAVFWTEYAIRHKGAHYLQPAVATMPWYQQAMLDIYATLAIIILAPIYILFKLIKLFYRLICCRSNKKITKKIKSQ